MDLEKIVDLVLFLAWLVLILMVISIHVRMNKLSSEDKKKKAIIQSLRKELRSYRPADPPVDRAKYKRTHHG